MTDDEEAGWQDFKAAVNMTPKELREWLETEDSQQVGQKSDGNGESVGHAAGRRILDILDTRKADLSQDDHEHMKKVVGYVHRHMAQRPDGDIIHTHWRYSLMNWGHDPDR